MSCLSAVIPLRCFLSREQYTVRIRADGEQEQRLTLPEGRRYYIPDYQREISWNPRLFLGLIRDIDDKEKLLGNISLTLKGDDAVVSDGQQRTTLLLMLLTYIGTHYNGMLDFTPCMLYVENFEGYEAFASVQYNEAELSAAAGQAVADSDDYEQRGRYVELWNAIEESGVLATARKADLFLRKLKGCTLNVLVKTEASALDDIQDFIDTNVKRAPLSPENVFQGHLYRMDAGPKIRSLWRELKKTTAKLNRRGQVYPVMEVIEHAINCCQRTECGGKYASVRFNKQFEVTSKSQDNKIPKGEHLLVALNDREFARTCVEKAVKFVGIALELQDSTGVGSDFRALFQGAVDSTEEVVIHNLLQRILLDDNLMPKLLAMKFILSVLCAEKRPPKGEFKKIYGIHAFYVLFTMFESSKSRGKVLNIVLAEDWYGAMVEQIQAFFPLKWNAKQIERFGKPDGQDRRFRCRGLAALYNFMELRGGKIVVPREQMEELKQFLEDENKYSLEHFLVQDGKGIAYKSGARWTLQYSYSARIKKYSMALLNFLFLSKNLNDQLGEQPIAIKLSILEKEKLPCAYSAMVLEAARTSFTGFPDLACCTSLSKAGQAVQQYYAKGRFKEEYGVYADKVRYGLEAELARKLSGTPPKRT